MEPAARSPPLSPAAAAAATAAAAAGERARLEDRATRRQRQELAPTGQQRRGSFAPPPPPYLRGPRTPRPPPGAPPCARLRACVPRRLRRGRGSGDGASAFRLLGFVGAGGLELQLGVGGPGSKMPAKGQSKDPYLPVYKSRYFPCEGLK